MQAISYTSAFYHPLSYFPYFSSAMLLSVQLVPGSPLDVCVALCVSFAMPAQDVRGRNLCTRVSRTLFGTTRQKLNYWKSQFSHGIWHALVCSSLRCSWSG